MSEMFYEVGLLDGSSFKIFKGVYNDFRAKAINEYKFELEPLEYEEFISAVEKGFCQYGILPIENSSAGSVNQVYDLMKKHKF